MRKREPETFVLVRVPAEYISKKNPNSDIYRKCIEETTGMCYGRCDWTHPQYIRCRHDQFSKLVLSIGGKGLPTIDFMARMMCYGEADSHDAREWKRG